MTATQARFLAHPPPEEVARALDRLVEAPDVVHLAVMPDVRVPRGRHRRAAWRSWPGDLHPDALSSPPLVALARGEGLAQLGTLGSGNHFIELQADEDEVLWIMLHSGSRGMGPAIRALHAAVAEPAGALRALDASSVAGQRYLSDMRWALRYADANREYLLAATEEAVAVALGAPIARESLITCHHNHARLEVHGGRPLWVHRKGAMPAGIGELGVVPGSMGSPSYHVEGRGLESALCSSAHGAGRAMSRSEARRRISPGALHRQLEGVAWDHRRAGVLREEAPTAYKDIERVMRAQRELVRIIRRLRPLLSYKAT